MLPKEIRPRAFAAVELLLDTIHSARSLVHGDLETVIIYYSIAEATMHPLVLGNDAPEAVRRAKKPPEAYRGSISRLLISERTGIPRETVRRKINKLIEAGLVESGPDGRVRSTRNLDSPQAQKVVLETFAIVRRYNDRLRQLGCETPSTQGRQSPAAIAPSQ